MNTEDHLTSTCGADRQWTVPPLKCRNQCDKKIKIKASDDSTKCGFFQTTGYPKVNYKPDDECVWIIDNEDNPLDHKINFMYKDLQLDYNSIFQLQCQKDRLHVFHSKPSNSSHDQNKFNKNDAVRICQTTDMKLFGFSGGSTDMSVDKNTVYNSENDHSYLEFQFRADAQLNGKGVYIEWWTDHYSNTPGNDTRPESCKPHSEKDVTKTSVYQTDHDFGRTYDYYHTIYIVVLAIVFLVLIIKGVKFLIDKLRFGKKEDEFLDDDESDLDSDEEDSDDDSDVYDQYDMEQEEDDVDDFSLLTLLEMKANRTELGTAVDKLAKEIDQLDNEDEDGEEPSQPSSGKL